MNTVGPKHSYHALLVSLTVRQSLVFGVSNFRFDPSSRFSFLVPRFSGFDPSFHSLCLITDYYI